MIKREHSLEYHESGRPGKIELRSTKPCLSPREMRLAYLPGAAFPAIEISHDPAAVFRYTARGNLVGVVTNGTAVPGLGNVGPEAAKPMQEGIAVLFKRLADIDVFDLELNTTDPDRFVETVRMLEPSFGGINLKDVRAPEGLYIYEKLKNALSIPVFHENLYSTAVVAAAALINALELVSKRVDEVRVVLCGAGTVGTGCARLLLMLGVSPENLLVYDIKGLLHADRDDLLDHQRSYARNHAARQLADGVRGADVFIGASAAGVLTLEMLRSMNRFPIVFALATPEPEIAYETARNVRQDVIVATGLGEYPNAVLDLLSFPYIFRGALDVQATAITENMLLATARALAELAREDVPQAVDEAYGSTHFTFGPEYLLPKAIDPRILVWASAAVARQAIADGVARKTVEDAQYQENLIVRMGTGRETLRGMILRARAEQFRVVFPEGTNETILRACSILLEEGIATPVLLGNEAAIGLAIDRLGLDLRGITVIDPAHSPRVEAYAEEYFIRARRRGVIRAAASHRLRQPDYFAAMMVSGGDADMMIAGFSTHVGETIRTILGAIGTAPGVRRISSHHLVLLPKDAVLLADGAINIDPKAEDLAEIALLAARMARTLGLEPRVAMLSFSNFGNIDHPLTRKVRAAAAIAREHAPDLVIDGEMQLAVARSSTFRGEYFPFCNLDKDANVLIFPDLQSAHLAMDSLQFMGDAKPIGPMLMGTRLPAHYIQYGATVEEVVNLTAIAIVEAASIRK
jgi:malate dehydrogenase (oxaloacetate-decarboxylating)(NADP+)